MFLKNYCHTWNQHPWIYLIARYCEIMKMPKFGTKNVLFGYFWPKISSLDIFGARFFERLLPYLKSTPSNLDICKISRKTKMSKFGTKNVSFMYFWAGIWKQYYYIWNQHPRICLFAKFRQKTKMPKFGTKNALLGIFGLEF